MADDSIFTMTPGSNVANTVQAILQQRRDLARQAMIDELKRRDTESTISARDITGQNDTKRTDASVAYDKQLGDQAEATALETKGRAAKGYFEGMPSGANPDNMDPSMRQWGNEHEFFGNQPQTGVVGSRLLDPQTGQPIGDTAGPEATTQPTGPKVFLGDQARRESDAAKAMINSPEFQKLDPLHQTMVFIRAGYAKDLPEKQLGGQGHLRVLDEASGKVNDGGVMNPNDHAVVRNRPPVAPAAFTVAGADTVTGKPQVINNRTGKLVTETVAGASPESGGALGAKPSATSQGSTGKVPPAVLTGLAEARKWATPGSTIGNRDTGQGADLAKYNQLQQSVVRYYSAPLQPVIRAVLNPRDPNYKAYSGKSASEIADFLATSGAIPPGAANELAGAITEVRGH